MNKLCEVIILQTGVVPYFWNTTEEAVHAVAQLVEELPSKPEGHGFDFLWVYWDFSFTYSFGCTMFLGSTQPVTEMGTRGLSWGKGGQCLVLHVPIFRNSGRIKIVET
jgi:hypothetical protein